MILRFVNEHNDKVIGVLVALFLVTSILLLIRSIGEKDEGSSAGGAVDLSAIEGAMRKVLSSQPVAVTVASTTGLSSENIAGGGPESAQLQELIASKEKTIEDLTAELETLKSGGGEGGGDASGLQARLEELQARLAEYEIIEDDIADLSLFKEENSRLKDEVERLKEQVTQAAQAGPASKVRSENEAVLKFEKADKFELDPDDDVMKQFAAVVSDSRGGSAPEPALQFEKSEKFELDPNDDIMMQFAQAVETQKAPPPESTSILPQDEAAEMVASAEVATPTAALADDPQAAIDAMFASAVAAEKKPEELAKVETAPTPIAAPAPADDPQAAIDAMFASAVAAEQGGGEAAIGTPSETIAAESTSDDDPLAGVLDTDKMLTEVQALDSSFGEEVEDALSAALDTEKLLAEMGTIDAPLSAAPKTTEMTENSINIVDLNPDSDANPVDDLLAEFKDAKGS